jgi:hypothetical protein
MRHVPYQIKQPKLQVFGLAGTVRVERKQPKTYRGPVKSPWQRKLALSLRKRFAA